MNKAFALKICAIERENIKNLSNVGSAFEYTPNHSAFSGSFVPVKKKILIPERVSKNYNIT